MLLLRLSNDAIKPQLPCETASFAMLLRLSNDSRQCFWARKMPKIGGNLILGV